MIRNRIIAVVVLCALVALMASLVTCVARGLAGGAGVVGQSEQAVGSDSVVSAVAAQAEQRTAALVVPEGAGVEDPWVPGGRFATGDAELDQMVKGFCDGNSDMQLNAQDNAYKVYLALAWAEYVENDQNQHPMGRDWDIQYAKQYFANSGGNCYEFAPALEYVLKYFGYSDAQAEPCLILRQSGTYGDHGIVFVTDVDGRACLCDTALGANGWMLDADSYTMKLTDVGQDPSEYAVADFEEVVRASWRD